VRRVVRARMRNDDEIDDSIHEVFIHIFRYIGNLRDPSCIEPWSERIANNVVNTLIRKRNLFRKYTPLYRLAVEHQSHFPDLINRAFAQRVIDTMSRLPKRDRGVLYQYWFEPVSLEQMAALAKCSSSSMTRRIRRARTRFDLLARRDRYLSRLMQDASL
jgi:RNA polymerase sigma factor (sigma-70 family)